MNKLEFAIIYNRIILYYIIYIYIYIYIYNYEYFYVLLKHLQSMGIDDQLPRIPQGFQMCQGY